MLNSLSSHLHTAVNAGRQLCGHRDVSPTPQPTPVSVPAVPLVRPQPYPQNRAQQKLFSQRHTRRTRQFIPGLYAHKSRSSGQTPTASTPVSVAASMPTPIPMSASTPVPASTGPEPKLDPKDTPPSSAPKYSLLTEQEFQQLQQGECVNDRVINYTLTKLHAEHAANYSNGLVNSFFFCCFAGKNPMTLPRRPNLENFTAERVFWPCHNHNQWFMVVVDNKHNCLWVVDSFYNEQVVSEDQAECSQATMYFANRIRSWHQHLLNQHDRTEQAQAMQNWPVLRQPMPMQENNKDCGVAMLWAAEQLLQRNSDLGSVLAAAPYRDYRQHLCQSFQPKTAAATAAPS